MKKNFLDKLKVFYKKHRRLPSYAEMLTIFGYASKKAVFDVIQKFIGEGFLKKEDNKLVPTKHFFALPLLGVVKAGFPVLTEEDKQYLTLDDYLIEDPLSSFLFKVRGDSLINIGIFDGDIVIIERKREAKPGDIVLAEIDNEWTLKILKKDLTRRTLYLEAANPKYKPFYPKYELKIFGVVKASIRKFSGIN